MREAALFLFSCLLLTSLLVYAPVEGQIAGDDVNIATDTLWVVDQDFVGTVYVDNGSTLTVQGSYLNCSGITVSNNSKLVFLDAMGDIGSVESESCDVNIQNSTLTAGLHIIVSNATLTITNSSIDGGAAVFYGSMNTENSLFTGTDFGVAALWNATMVADNITIQNTINGAAFIFSAGELTDTYISGCVEALSLESSYVTVEDSTFYMNEDGIAAYDNSILGITDSVISKNFVGYGPEGSGVSGWEIGIDAKNSEVTCDNVSITSNGVGIYSHTSEISLRNSLIENNTNGVEADDSEVDSETTTFSKNHIAITSRYAENPWLESNDTWGTNTFVDNNYTFSQEWSVEVRVTDESSVGVAGVQVRAEGNSSIGALNTTKTSGATGLAFFEYDQSLVSFFLFDNGTRIDVNYTLNLTKNGTNTSAPFMFYYSEYLPLGENRVVNITLPIYYPDVESWISKVDVTDDGESIEVYVQVNNTGGAAALDFDVEAWANGTDSQSFIGSRTINISANDSMELLFIWDDVSPDDYTILVKLDTSNVLEDHDISNDISTYDLTIKKGIASISPTRLIGGVVVAAGAIFLLLALRRQKPDVGKPV